jgi:hypothetical protein
VKVPRGPELIEVVAVIRRQRVSHGSKSDRVALVAKIEGRMLALRRRGALSFAQDEELSALMGQTVRLRGTKLTTVFVVDEVVIPTPKTNAD